MTSPHARPLPGGALWRDFSFITLAAGAALSLFAQIGLITHLYSLLVPALGAEWAGLVMGIGTGAGMGGRMVVGWLMPVGADRRLVACMSYAVQIVGTLVLIVAAGENMPLLLAGVLLFGVGIGNVTSMPPLIAQVEFVKDDVPRVVALVVAIGQATYAFAPAAFGFIREFAGAGALFARSGARLPAGDRRAADRPLRLDEIGARVALKIEQRGEVAVVDARVRGFGDLRLGVIGDAEAGRLDHRKIVRAVARRERLLRREAEAIAQLDQRRELGLAAEHRLLRHGRRACRPPRSACCRGARRSRPSRRRGR